MKIPLLLTFTAAEKARLIAEYFQPKQFKPDEAIVQKGEEPKDLFFIMSGTAEVRITKDFCVELNAGDSIGELAFFDQRPRSATVFARDNVQVAQLSRESFFQLNKDFPAMAQRITQNVIIILGDKIRQTDEEIRRREKAQKRAKAFPEAEEEKRSLSFWDILQSRVL
jgi:CRP-like cAMP-binding protein